MKLEEYKKIIELSLDECVTDLDHELDGLADSMRYSLLAGGKRLRPALVLEFNRICGGKTEVALPVACAIEMLHTYSLIHDDLPCMDDDVTRRGKPTNHVVYGECTAVIAGDALQAEAFALILSSNIPDAQKNSCALTLAMAAGARGMCGGQYLDMKWENQSLSPDNLDSINSRKTGAIISAACMMGVQSAGGSDAQVEAARKYGEFIGAAFQIRDDILDVISTEEELGKPIGSDAENNKNTYMELLGRNKCEEIISELTDKAKAVVKDNFTDAEFLCSLADKLAVRLS